MSTIRPLLLSAGVTADSTPSSQKRWVQHKTSVSDKMSAQRRQGWAPVLSPDPRKTKGQSLSDDSVSARQTRAKRHLRLVDPDQRLQRAAAGIDHRPAELVEQALGGPVASGARLSLQLQREDAVGMSGDAGRNRRGGRGAGADPVRVSDDGSDGQDQGRALAFDLNSSSEHSVLEVKTITIVITKVMADTFLLRCGGVLHHPFQKHL